MSELVPVHRSLFFKARIAVHVWTWMARIFVARRRLPLQALVDELWVKTKHDGRFDEIPPRHLGGMVYDALTIRGRGPRCLSLALVLFAIMRERGLDPSLVIGLPDGSQSTDAHAWVELDGADIGPPPGRGPNVELVRYP